MNGGKETGASLGRNKTAQFSLTECLSNYLTQWKRSQNITAKYLWNKMYNSTGTWHAAWAPHKGLAIFDLTGAANGSVDGKANQRGRLGRWRGEGDWAAGPRGVHHSQSETVCGDRETSEPKHRGSRHLDWMLQMRQPLSNTQLLFTTDANINTWDLYAAYYVLVTAVHILTHLSLTTAPCIT